MFPCPFASGSLPICHVSRFFTIKYVVFPCPFAKGPDSSQPHLNYCPADGCLKLCFWEIVSVIEVAWESAVRVIVCGAMSYRQKVLSPVDLCWNILSNLPANASHDETRDLVYSDDASDWARRHFFLWFSRENIETNGGLLPSVRRLLSRAWPHTLESVAPLQADQLNGGQTFELCQDTPPPAPGVSFLGKLLVYRTYPKLRATEMPAKSNTYIDTAYLFPSRKRLRSAK